LIVTFEFQWQWVDGHPVCAGFTGRADIPFHIRFARPSHFYIDESEGLTYPDGQMLRNIVDTGP
jgi:hypothetical protein